MRVCGGCFSDSCSFARQSASQCAKRLVGGVFPRSFYFGDVGGYWTAFRVLGLFQDASIKGIFDHETMYSNWAMHTVCMAHSG